jgi:predicted nucleic acid-binding protein
LAAALDLAFYEAADALWKRVRRGDMEPGRAEAALGEILEFLRSVEVRAYGEVAREAFRKAVDRGVTVYDAAYAALAEVLGGVLITLDGELAERFPGLASRPRVSPS